MSSDNSILNLPTDMKCEILRNFYPSNPYHCVKIRVLNKQFAHLIDQLSQESWNKLIGEVHNDQFKGPINVPELMEKVEKLTTNPSCRLFKVQKEFAKFNALLFRRRVPTTAADFAELQKQIKDNSDQALIAIWPKICATLQIGVQLNTGDEIRNWLIDPNNSADLNQIKRLDLNDLDLKVFPDELTRLSQLEHLNLSNNKLASLPESFGKLTQMKNLSLGNNNLKSLPESFVDLSQLGFLSLNMNKLTSLPESFGKLTRLDQLYISYNKLTSLPASVTDLTQLKKFYLDYNQISKLPESLGNLTSLDELRANSNKITTLPKSFANLIKLTSLYIGSNPFTSMPEEVLHSNNPLIRNCPEIAKFRK
jgi:Leucine-rich repeat (LRR) protein